MWMLVRRVCVCVSGGGISIVYICRYVYRNTSCGHIQTDRQTHTQTHRQTDRQTDRQTHTKRERESDTLNKSALAIYLVSQGRRAEQRKKASALERWLHIT
jgi:hypothetical protein